MAQIKVIDREGNEHTVEGRPGLKLMEILRELDYGVTAICGGMCSCATCHVYVDPQWVERVPPKQSDEQELLTELPGYRAEASRLSCQIDFTEGLDGLTVTIGPDDY
jgi:ferredoxin, 2Fe-2S